MNTAEASLLVIPNEARNPPLASALDLARLARASE